MLLLSYQVHRERSQALNVFSSVPASIVKRLHRLSESAVERMRRRVENEQGSGDNDSDDREDHEEFKVSALDLCTSIP